jgi:hypothetical protein
MKYVVIHKQKESKLVYRNVNIDGLSVLPVNRVPNLSIKAKKVVISDKELQTKYVKQRINRKIDKIITFILRILEEDDASSDDVNIVLDEISKFKGIVINKYKKYLSVSDYKSYLTKLILIEEEFKKSYNQKILDGYMKHYYVEEATNERGR